MGNLNEPERPLSPKELMYSIIQVNSTKEVNMQELIRFPWEHEDAPEGDAESLIEEMRAMATKLNQKVK